MINEEQKLNLGRFKSLSQNFAQKYNKKENIAYSYLILTFFTVAFFGFFVIRPAISTISNLQKELQDNKRVYQGLQDKLAAIQKLDTQYQTLQTNIPLVYEAVPNTPKIPLLTRQIETIAQSNNVFIQSLTVSPVEFYPLETGTFSFGLNVVGEEKNIDSFIGVISGFNRAVSIDRISTGKSESGETSLSLSGKAYFKAK
jgi:Tfp pilus assembly protein PilO